MPLTTREALPVPLDGNVDVEPSRVGRTVAAAMLRGRTIAATWRLVLVVGTLNTVVNHGDTIVAGHATAATWARAACNYLVPFVVSSLAYIKGRVSTEADGVRRRRGS